MTERFAISKTPSTFWWLLDHSCQKKSIKGFSVHFYEGKKTKEERAIERERKRQKKNQCSDLLHLNSRFDFIVKWVCVQDSRRARTTIASKLYSADTQCIDIKVKCRKWLLLSSGLFFHIDNNFAMCVHFCSRYLCSDPAIRSNAT